ncbi:MAG: amylo-alpha-1,6-glucosidase [Candidatus Woesearchaeota archaeon]
MEKAIEIATQNLRQCYSNQGIVAGLHHFNDLWARDALFASWGALALGDTDIVRKTLITLLNHQNRDGQIPMRIGDYFFLPKLIGLRQATRARYKDDKANSYPTDQNSLLIITARKYLEQTHNLQVLEHAYPQLQKAIEWNITQAPHQLIEENPYASWTDSVKKRGKVLYTNTLHCQAIKDMAFIAQKVGQDRTHFLKLHRQVKTLLNQQFWNGKYYNDWITNAPNSTFSTDGNLLAILFNIASHAQAASIQRCISHFKINTIPSITNYPQYRFWETTIINRIVGLGAYHNGLSWLWLGALDVIAKKKMGKRKQAQALFQKIARIITKHKAVYEVYDSQGNPFKSLYRSEHPFAWNAALFLSAAKAISYI